MTINTTKRHPQHHQRPTKATTTKTITTTTTTTTTFFLRHLLLIVLVFVVSTSIFTTAISTSTQEETTVKFSPTITISDDDDADDGNRIGPLCCSKRDDGNIECTFTIMDTRSDGVDGGDGGGSSRRTTAAASHESPTTVDDDDGDSVDRTTETEGVANLEHCDDEEGLSRRRRLCVRASVVISSSYYGIGSSREEEEDGGGGGGAIVDGKCSVPPADDVDAESTSAQHEVVGDDDMFQESKKQLSGNERESSGSGADGMKQQKEEPKSSTETEKEEQRVYLQQDGSIVLNFVTYQSPYDQYGSYVSTPLHALSDYLMQIQKQQRQQTFTAFHSSLEEIQDILNRAVLYTNLALGHRDHVAFNLGTIIGDEEEGKDFLNDNNSDDDEYLGSKSHQIEFDKSMNAASAALMPYDDVIMSSKVKQLSVVERITLAMRHAELNLYIGESYQLYSPTGHVDYTMALMHYDIAENMYATTLEMAKKERTTMDRVTKVELELGLADAAVRAGAVMLDLFSTSLVGGGSGGTAEELVASLSEDGGTTTVVEKAITKFELAVSIFRRISTSPYATMDDPTGNTKLSLADALHNIGVASTYEMHMERATEAWEESLHIYKSFVGETPKDFSVGRGQFSDGDDENLASYGMIIAETLISLSDAYLQSGSFQNSKNRYREAMGWYAELNPDGGVLSSQLDGTNGGIMGGGGGPTATSVGNLIGGSKTTIAFESDEALQMHQDALQQYYNSINKPEMYLPDEYGDKIDSTGEYEYEPDELYEGDLHATLGSIYLARNDLDTAIDYLSKAIRLYKRNGLDNDAVMADTIVNIAQAHLRLGEYEESAVAYDKAADVYEVAVGEGNNPFLDENTKGGGGAGESLMDILSGMGRSRSVRKRGDNGATEDGNTNTPAATDKDKENENDKQEGGGGIVHERMIDLDEYQKGIMNMTRIGS